MHPGQHILYFGTLNDRHFSIPCAKPKRLCSSQTGNPRSMRGRGSKRVLLAIEPPDFDWNTVVFLIMLIFWNDGRMRNSTFDQKHIWVDQKQRKTISCCPFGQLVFYMPRALEAAPACIFLSCFCAVGRSGLRNLVNPENAPQYLDMFSAKRR